MPQLSCTHHLSGHLDPSSHQRLLMKTGLILIVIGHLNFIAGAFIHGIILCFMANPQDTTSLQYLVSNLVVSALLGVHTSDTAWMGMDAGCAHVGHGVDAGRSLGSLSCLLGLPLSTGLVLGSWCQVLLAPCTFTNMTFIQAAHECPFIPPPRVYSSLLSLWTFSLVLDLVQIVFSIRCLLLSLSTLCPGRCCRRIHRKKETLAPSPRGSPLPHAAPRAARRCLVSAPQLSTLGSAQTRSHGTSPGSSPRLPQGYAKNPCPQFSVPAAVPRPSLLCPSTHTAPQRHPASPQPGFWVDTHPPGAAHHRPCSTSPSPRPQATCSCGKGGERARAGLSPRH
ncbi:LOW QUALITY PROTEIN: transmembrane protein 54 [Apteryx mantelli]|uniref:LOW QUALITY PROTEIN: transmembrane protein 54 n=1 Tax=Apteryx mantelli TaxID=2696672 RepID=A0ABM4FSC9_9AVES